MGFYRVYHKFIRFFSFNILCNICFFTEQLIYVTLFLFIRGLGSICLVVVMSSSSGESDDDAERSLLKRAGLPQRFGKRRQSTEMSSFRGDHERRRNSSRGAMYDDDDMPVSKYDLMSSAERREEQARIEAGVKQVRHARLPFQSNPM